MYIWNEWNAGTVEDKFEVVIDMQLLKVEVPL